MNNINIVRSPQRRRPALFIKSDGSLELRVPVRLSDDTIKKFLESAGPWVEKHRIQMQQQQQNKLPHGHISVAGIVCRIEFSSGITSAQLTAPEILSLPEKSRDSAELRERYLQDFFRRLARTVMEPMVRYFASRLDREVRALRITGAATRWGSCSSRGNINISWRTAQLPLRLAEMIAAHEAAHLVEMNHSKKFYAVLDTLVPDWKLRAKELKQERFKYADS